MLQCYSADVAHLPPSIALSSCENALRQLLTHVLSKRLAEDWLTEALPAATISKWEDRREVEVRKRTTRGVVAVPQGLLHYAEFYELVDLARKNWDDVFPALGRKVATGALLDRFDDLRNTVAHSRDLLPFEEDLLAGIAGEIRNRVTLYMTEQAPNGQHFARIEEVVDSFGNRVDGLATLEISNPNAGGQQTLGVGDVVTFRARGTDPHGRKLHWTLSVVPHGYDLDHAEGEDVELTWTVAPRHVSSRSYAIVRLVANSEFHRWSDGVDGSAAYFYSVTPPHP